LATRQQTRSHDESAQRLAVLRERLAPVLAEYVVRHDRRSIGGSLDVLAKGAPLFGQRRLVGRSTHETSLAQTIKPCDPHFGGPIPRVTQYRGWDLPSAGMGDQRFESIDTGADQTRYVSVTTELA
jgi:hypothetical protein